ncbi:DNA-protecting protein DprA [Saccharibacter sp. 17.LH.SD]|uniref:DNA-processing protein DprA n=1 Tax=Saccharibacter sp. 17.LH.SD TaxID=2689393 RepID=UPI001367B267|nr:DNA-processing protein DprA [Saccharibacter sp. 17.LH.SD]MXV43836.1 DNA-protecting protein DprA [Saccharibacter sp. 17.LH.SD]
MSTRSTTALTNQHERLSMLRLARTSGIGPVNFARLLGLYGTASRALEALPHRFQRNGRTPPDIPTLTEIEDEIATLAQRGARHLLRSDPEYPLLLTHIPDAPPLLFVQGNTQRLSINGVGIVGARNASSAGLRLAESIAAELAAGGICIVSGLARGVDTAAHRGALHPGLTVAALAGGLDHPYPPENKRLQEEIAEKGCLITEAPLGSIPQARHFPRRNRLIAGITQGCLVIEAALHSGTLITASLAESYHRTVFATPGSPLDPRSRGGNQLIRQGSLLVENGMDVLTSLPQHLPVRQPAPWEQSLHDETPLFESRQSINSTTSRPAPSSHSTKFPAPKDKTAASSLPKNTPSAPLSSPEDIQKKLLSLLSITPTPVDEIVSRCQFSVSAVTTALSELELDGVVERLPGGRVARLPD